MTIELRPITRDDAADPVIVGWHTDPAGYDLMYEQPSTPHQARDMIEIWAGRWETHGFGYWIAEQDGQPVGIGGVQCLSYEGTDYLNLYYRVDPSTRGRGVGLRIARAGTAYAFEHQPSLPVLARIAPANAPSLALVARSGLVDVGPVRGPNDPPDKPAPITWQSPVVRREPGEDLVRLFAPTGDTWDDPSSIGPMLGHALVSSGEIVIDPSRSGRGFDGVLRAALRARA